VDEAGRLVAMPADERLSDLGHQAAWVVLGISEALAELDSSAFGLALLDVSLSGTYSFPVADRAAERGIPVLFVTGYGSDHMDRLAGQSVLQKPYTSSDLERAIAGALEQGRVRG